MKITARKNIPFFNRKELLQIMKKRPAIQHTLLFLLLLFLLCVTSACKVHARITTLITGTQKNVTQAETVTGTWEKTESGVTFKPQDGKIITNQWINFKGKIYYLDSKGQRVTEWVLYRGKRYYLTKYGVLRFGWIGKRYMLKSTGAMAKGWQQIYGETYYFNSKGNRVTGWKKIKGSYYYFDPNGILQKNCWIRTSGHTYRLDTNGKRLISQWIRVKNKKYYLNEKGYRVTGDVLIKGKWYHFKNNGVYDPTAKVDAPNPQKPMVALTFDDGPGPYTDRLLDCLKCNNAKATFFMVGSSVPGRASTVRRMAAMGCELGNHSWSHPRLSSLSNAGIQDQISRTSSAIRNAADKSPTLCRLPYGDGHNSSRVLYAVGLPSIYWSIDTRDWANTGNPQHTINAVLNSVQDGDIILMHDIHASSVTAAETIIPALISRGYQLVTVSELAKYKGNTTLRTGTTYYSFR